MLLSLLSCASRGQPLEATFTWSPIPRRGLDGAFVPILAPAAVEVPDRSGECRCDQPFLMCDEPEGLGEVTVGWSVERIEQWPVVPGYVGTCSYGASTIPVRARFALGPSADPWMRGDEIVVPITEDVSAGLVLPWGVPEATALAGDGAQPVSCTRVPGSDRIQLVVHGPELPQGGVFPCVRWGDRVLSVRVLPHE